MKRPRQPLYLERRNFRRRRMMDAARLLPFLGVFLLALPILWASPDAPEAETGGAGIYLFLIWFGLILAAFLLAPRLAAISGDEDGGNGGPGGSD